VAVIPALARTPATDPFVILAGGPGQAATSYAPWVASFFARIRRERDILLVDQRGTGASHPLPCPLTEAEGAVLPPAPSEAAVRSCVESLDGDLRQYTNAPAMEDLDEVRAVLGYPRVNIWAGSYGTRAALVYMRAHPDRVRAVVLDGVTPWSLRYPLYTARDGDRALRRLLDDCAIDHDCYAAFPALETHLTQVLESLAARPAALSVRHPRTGELTAFTVSRDLFGSALRTFLYVPTQASLVPLIIERARVGDFGPFAAMVQAVAGWASDTMSLGMTMSVLCSEDVPRIRDEEIAPVTQGTVVGGGEIAAWKAACGEWPRAEIPATATTPVTFAGPVLILSGDLDPVVPPSWGEEVHATLPRARHLVAPGVGHNVTPYGCAPSLIAEFVSKGAAEGLDDSCLKTLSRPPFVTSLSGARP